MKNRQPRGGSAGDAIANAASQKRMSEINQILESGFQAPKAPMDENEQWFIDRLLEKSISEADRSGCIDTLEMLLSLDALPSLMALLKDEEFTFELREKAAKAIANIGSSYVLEELGKERGQASLSAVILNR